MRRQTVQVAVFHTLKEHIENLLVTKRPEIHKNFSRRVSPETEALIKQEPIILVAHISVGRSLWPRGLRHELS
jgi:hypothetical protein